LLLQLIDLLFFS